MDSQFSCPQCSSTKVKKMNKSTVITVLLICAALFLWLGKYYAILWLGSFAFVVFAFFSLFNKGMLNCEDCNHTWKIT